jgi:hypothetical protein
MAHGYLQIAWRWRWRLLGGGGQSKKKYEALLFFKMKYPYLLTEV